MFVFMSRISFFPYSIHSKRGGMKNKIYRWWRRKKKRKTFPITLMLFESNLLCDNDVRVRENFFFFLIIVVFSSYASISNVGWWQKLWFTEKAFILQASERERENGQEYTTHLTHKVWNFKTRNAFAHVLKTHHRRTAQNALYRRMML